MQYEEPPIVTLDDRLDDQNAALERIAAALENIHKRMWWVMFSIVLAGLYASAGGH